MKRFLFTLILIPSIAYAQEISIKDDILSFGIPTIFLEEGDELEILDKATLAECYANELKFEDAQQLVRLKMLNLHSEQATERLEAFRTSEKKPERDELDKALNAIEDKINEGSSVGKAKDLMRSLLFINDEFAQHVWKCRLAAYRIEDARQVVSEYNATR